MAIKLFYKGCELRFDRPPTAAEIVSAYEAAHREPAQSTSITSRQAAGRPLSFAQEWLWYLDQAAPGSPAYHLPFIVRIEGAFDEHAFARAVTQVVRRHEVLRTAFPMIDGRPCAQLHPPESVTVTCVDLSPLPPSERDAESRRLVQQQLCAPFDLARGPVMRGRVFRLAPDACIVTLVVHHIASDAWSMGILAREVSAAYLAEAAGQTATLPPLPMQYADYAQWQHNRLHGQLLDKVQDYWRTQLQGAPACLQLPTRGPRPAIQRFDGARHAFAWPAGLARDLLALSRDSGVTLHMTLLAGFLIVLHRATGQEDLVVGTPMAGRSRLETEPLIGCFINTLPVRTSVAGDPRFTDLLTRVRTAALGAAAHQDLPFGRLVDLLRPARSASYTPFYQVIFDVNNTPPPSAGDLPGLAMRPFGEDTLATAKLDLVVDIWNTANGLAGAMEYATALFDADTIIRLARQYEALLRAVVTQPDARISVLAQLSDVDATWRRADERERESTRYQRLLTIQPRRVRHAGMAPDRQG